jgi:stearoyl-CoA desaturase (delta-9 desaturase)
MAKARVEQTFLALILLSPLIGLGVVMPLAWGHFLHWRDLLIGAVMYAVTGHGITVGFHRYFTHGAFKTNRGVKIALAVAGSMAIQGPVKRWVADHRRHHQFSDHEGDPHSPHLFGTGPWNLARGMFHAHVGWLFDIEQTNQKRFIPDLLADRDLRVIDRLFAPLAATSLALPALLGWVFSGFTLLGAATAFVWAGLVRVALLHHVTWSVNSICHTVGRTPFKTRDRSRNVWALAIISMGESWHNLHHSDPTAARHGVLRGQLDSSAFVIKVLERLRLARDVRWLSADRIASRRMAPSA